MASPSITSFPEKTINTYLSKWNASSLPIQYVITNDKFPVGATVTNYYTEVMVYVGGSLINTIKQIPDANNETKIDVSKYVQSTLAFERNDAGPIDDNAWKEIYITGSENYVDSSGVTQSNAITGGGSGVIHYATLSALQFGNANGGNMYDYLIDSNKLDLAKWMTTFERGKITDYNNYTLSIIVDEDSEEFNIETNQYDINDNLLDTSTYTTAPDGGGLFRIYVDELDINYDSFTTYITVQATINDNYGTPLSELHYIDVDLGCTIAPGTPIELALSNITSSSMTLTWVDKAFRETSYAIQRSLTGTGGWTKIATTAKDVQTYIDSGLSYATAYYYRIKANQTDGVSSPYSNIASDIYELIWTARTSSNESNSWKEVTYGNGVFVAVSSDGTGRVMRSTDDGVNWTGINVSGTNGFSSVAYGNGVFVAVSTNSSNRVIRSTDDGLSWTGISSGVDNNGWRSVTYGNGVFTAVASSGANRVMRSTDDGVNWTGISSGVDANSWFSIAYGNSTLIAVANSGANRSMWSNDDGVTWNAVAVVDANSWQDITYGNGIFMAVSSDGANRSMWSNDDGVTWNAQSTSDDSSSWVSLIAAENIYLAVSTSGTNQSMLSPDTSPSWLNVEVPSTNAWRSITYGNGVFVAVAQTGTDRVMTGTF